MKVDSHESFRQLSLTIINSSQTRMRVVASPSRVTTGMFMHWKESYLVTDYTGITKPKRGKKDTHLRTENLKNHTLSLDTIIPYSKHPHIRT